MTDREIGQFEAIVKLYAEVNSHHHEFYTARYADMGYLSIQQINAFGLVEQAQLHRTPEELYHFYEDRWETDWLYDYADAHEMENLDLEAIQKALPLQVRTKLTETHISLKQQAEQILNN